jgi:FixJ family two-component response regulator
MRSESGKISIVADDGSIHRATSALLRSVGYQVETFASAESFLESDDALRETDCLVLDVRMPGIDGLELQRRLNAAQSHVPIIFVTAHDDKSYRTTAMDAGAVNFFHTPFEANAFVAAVQAALRNSPSFEGSQPETTGAPLLARLVPSVTPIATAMAECIYCGAKTHQHVNGPLESSHLVCLHCAKNHKLQHASEGNGCEEYTRLLKAYQESMALFSLTVGALEAARATVPIDEFRRQAGYLEQARMRSDQARAELDKHATEHGCSPALSAEEVYHGQM